ncbi:MAG TPA: ABC transporter permease subunit, partial [Nocardioidaceae bacterium]
MSGVTAEPPVVVPPETGGEPGRWRQYALAAGFLAPAAVFLGIWVLYPTVRTFGRSFFDNDGNFVWIDNYKEIFTTDVLRTAVKNNAIWVAVVPAFVTAIGLIFAVLTERIRWSVAFKTVVFMPMAISAFAAGITWRIVYTQDPNLGALNAGIKVVHDSFGAGGAIPDARPSNDELTGSTSQGFTTKSTLEPGDVARIGLTAIAPDELPARAVQAVQPEPLQGGINGVVWRDFKPGGGVPGKVEQGELGIPGVTMKLLNADGDWVGNATSTDNGTFQFDDVSPGTYRVQVASATFAQPFGGVSWLGSKLITPAIMIAYIWIWAGFAMVVIAAGLAAIPRDTLEAARTDGATEWQVFRRITVPLLAPVLSVVFITMIINVLKVFDIVVAVAPGSVQDDAN